MVKDTLVSSFSMFRPNEQTGTSARLTFTKYTVANVKLNQSSNTWVTDSTGATQSKGATLFFNVGVSSVSPSVSPLFKAGDMICTVTSATTPPTDRFIVKSVTEHTFRGVLHHIEVVLA